ncbi:MAG: hypothetical protein ACP5IL_00915 [Syntrophobacteraceae bacterium]
MNWRKWLLLMLLVLFTVGVCACSKEREAKKSIDKFTSEKTKAIENYGKRPIDKARQVQMLGEQRGKDIDNAVKQSEH